MSSDGDSVGVEASLMNSIRMLGFADDVVVRDVMKTDTTLLCYKYKKEL